MIGKFISLRTQAFWIATIAYSSAYIIRETINSAVVSKEWTGAGSYLLFGTWAGMITIGYSVGKFFLGAAADRWNAKKVLAWSLISTAFLDILSLFLIEINLPRVAIITFFILGWIQGVVWPPIAKFFAFWFTKKIRVSSSAVWSLSHNLGSALTPIVVFFSTSWFFRFFGKTSSAILPAGIAIILGIIALLFFVDIPQTEELPDIQDIPELIGDEPRHPHVELKTDKNKFQRYVEDIKYIVTNPIAITLGIAQGSVGLIRFIPTYWILLYLKSKFDFNLENSGYIYSIYQLMGIPGTIIAGIIADWLITSKIPLIGGKERTRFMLFIMGIMLIPIIVFSIWHNSITTIVISVIGIGFMIYMPYHILGMTAIEMVSRKYAANISGLMGLITYMSIGLLNGILLGYLIENKGGFIWIFIFYFVYWVIMVSSTFVAFTFERNINKRKS